MRAWLSQRLEITRGVVLGITSTFVIAQAVILAAVVVVAVGLVDAQDHVRRLARDNSVAIAELKRTDDRLKRIEKPSTEQLTQASLDALRAIRSCARSASCRRRNPGVAAVARSIPRGDIPRRAPRRTSGGRDNPRPNVTSSRPPLENPPASRGPSSTGNTPQPTTPAAPARPPASSPANPPASPPKPQTPAAPTPRPGVTVTPPATPTVTVPPITVPPVSVPIPPLPGV